MLESFGTYLVLLSTSLFTVYECHSQCIATTAHDHDIVNQVFQGLLTVRLRICARHIANGYVTSQPEILIILLLFVCLLK